jgi:hypothetical protein
VDEAAISCSEKPFSLAITLNASNLATFRISSAETGDASNPQAEKSSSNEALVGQQSALLRSRQYSSESGDNAFQTSA